MFRRRKKEILGTAAAVFALTMAITLFMPETYESNVSFLVERSGDQDSESALSVLQRVGRANTTETEIQILTSRRVVESVVDELDLHVRVETSDGPKRLRDLFPKYIAGADVVPGSYILEAKEGGYRVRSVDSDRIVAEAKSGGQLDFAGLRLTLPAEGVPKGTRIHVQPFLGAVAAISGSISAERVDPQAAVIGLTCKGPSAAEARDICAVVTGTYLSLRGELQRAQASTAADFLNDQVAKIQQRLTTAEDSLQVYEARNRAVALQTRASQQVQQFAELTAQRELLRAEYRALSDLLERIEGGGDGTRKYRDLASFPTFLTGDTDLVATLLTTLVELENQRGEIASRRSDEDPEIIALDRRISQIENDLRVIATGYRQALEEQIGSLDGALSSSSRELEIIPEQQVQVTRFSRQVTLLEEMYRFLQTRLREAEVAEAVNLPSARVVDRASLPIEPASPNRLLNLVMGIFLGLGFGVVVGLVREHTDTRLREPMEVEAKTGLPVLSVVPRVRGQLLPGAMSSREDRLKERMAAREAFRSLAVELDFVGERIEEERLQLVALASPGRGEGKSFAACNLAGAQALRGARTLIIDADLYACGISRMLKLNPGGRNNAKGLSDLLAGTGELQEAIHHVKTEGLSLYVVPSGTTLRPPLSRLLEGQRLDELLDHFRREFDLIVLDTPPLNLLSDATTLTAKADGVVIVVRSGITEADALEQSLRRLRRARVNLAGVIVNDLQVPRYYYDRYSYGRTES